METKIKVGEKYKHYKGDIYKVIAIAKDKETGEFVVVYERQTDLHNTGWKTWVRPLSLFEDQIERPHYKGPRFEHIAE